MQFETQAPGWTRLNVASFLGSRQEQAMDADPHQARLSDAALSVSSDTSASSIRFGPRLDMPILRIEEMRGDLEAAGRHVLRRALAWASALCALVLGCVAALVGALDTRRVCVGILEATCDGPNWGEALVAFGLACALLTVGVVLVVRLRRGARVGPA